LKGYGRVDFRVDSRGRPWVLEINANPCLAPDAGFAAAAIQTGVDFKGVVERIIDDVWAWTQPGEDKARPGSRAVGPMRGRGRT
jgi:hypothetical protein